MNRVYVFELEHELDDHRWRELTRCVDESSLLYALLAYMVDSDSYYLSEIADLQLGGTFGSDLWFALSDWADDAFILWESRIDLFRLHYFGMLKSVRFSKAHNCYAIEFGDEDEQQESDNF